MTEVALTADQAIAFATMANDNPAMFLTIKPTISKANLAKIETSRGVIANQNVLKVLEFNKFLVPEADRTEAYANSLKKLLETLPQVVQLVNATIAEKEHGTPGSTERKVSRKFVVPVSGGNIMVQVSSKLGGYKLPK